MKPTAMKATLKTSPPSPRPRPLQSGATLIEVLVAMTLLAIGLLGMAGMTAASIKYNQISRIRGVGVALVNDLAERARVNFAGFDAAGYDGLSTHAYAPIDLTAAAPTPGCSNIAADQCSAAQLGAYDLDLWRRNVVSRLPGGDARVSTNSRATGVLRNMDIWLMWLDQAQDDGLALAQACPADVYPEGKTAANFPELSCMFFHIDL